MNLGIKMEANGHTFFFSSDDNAVGRAVASAEETGFLLCVNLAN
jgi:hypothetical protein